MARFLGFWAVAARRISSRAPLRPLSLKPSSLRMGLRWATAISAFLRSRREVSKASVLAKARRRSRTSSSISRGTLRDGAFGQHLHFKGQAFQGTGVSIELARPVQERPALVHLARSLGGPAVLGGPQSWGARSLEGLGAGADVKDALLGIRGALRRAGQSTRPLTPPPFPSSHPRPRA